MFIKGEPQPDTCEGARFFKQFSLESFGKLLMSIFRSEDSKINNVQNILNKTM